MRTMEVLRQHYSPELMASFEAHANEEVEWVLQNEGFFETVDVYNFVWPVRATSLNKANAVWQREWVRIDQLKEMEAKGFYKNVDQVGPWTGDDRRTDLAVRFAAQGIQPHTLTDQADAAEVEVWERWEDDRLTVIANKMIVLRDEPNPFHPQAKAVRRLRAGRAARSRCTALGSSR